MSLDPAQASRAIVPIVMLIQGMNALVSGDRPEPEMFLWVYPGIFLWYAVFVGVFLYQLAGMVVGALMANSGKPFRFPYIRLLR